MPKFSLNTVKIPWKTLKTKNIYIMNNFPLLEIIKFSYKWPCHIHFPHISYNKPHFPHFHIYTYDVHIHTYIQKTRVHTKWEKTVLIAYFFRVLFCTLRRLIFPYILVVLCDTFAIQKKKERQKSKLCHRNHSKKLREI